jgi:hypothetical protein
MTPLLVLAEFGCSEAGDAELRAQLERTLAETRAVAGGRWTQGKPGWSEAEPKTCRQCGVSLASGAG